MPSKGSANRTSANPSRALSGFLLLTAMMGGGAVADEWLVYVGGGIQSVSGSWEEQGTDVTFTGRNGTLVSVPYEDVDLATSTFVTWQLNGRRRLPPRSAVPPAAPTERLEAPRPACVPARIAGFSGGETFEIRHGDVQERVHAACLDAPETEHGFVELGWFGRVTEGAVRLKLKVGAPICVSEQSPPLRDEAGHRVVHVTLEGGQDYSRELIAGGLGLLRSAGCDRAAEYRRLEDGAIARQRGLWGGDGRAACHRGC